MAILGCTSAVEFSSDSGGDESAREEMRIEGDSQINEGVSEVINELDVTDFKVSGLRAREVPAGEYVFKNSGSWENFLEKYQDGPPPEIDFGKHALVAVFLGSRPNPGYSVAIVGASERGGEVIVRVAESPPSPGMMYAQVIVYPYDMALIPNADKPILFATIKKAGRP
jgi:hypothetical protein